MKPFALALVGGCMAVALHLDLGHAQTPPTPVGVLDHLLCYKMVDPLQLQAAVTMFSQVQPQFSQRECRLIKPVEFCVPATKIPHAPPLTTPNLVGQPLQNDYICYLVQCAGSPVPPDENVTDQFGTRTQQKYRPFTICAPARKTPTTCHQAIVGSTKPAVCGGTCPTDGEKCAIDPTDKTCKCLPALPCQGGPDPHGVCGGTCPDPTQVCVTVTPPGTRQTLCECAPPPPPLCSKDAAGVCGGTCPNPAGTCLADTAGNCVCQPVGQGCVQNAAGACSGQCPDPTQACVSGPNGCACQTAQCGPTVDPLTGMCGGPCPPGLSCTQLPGSSRCQCAPSGCGSDPVTGACGGACPQGLQCGFSPASNSCQCLSTPCTTTAGPAGPVCGGVCPVFGQTCTLLAATGQCSCELTTTTTTTLPMFGQPCGPCTNDVCPGCAVWGHHCGVAGTPLLCVASQVTASVCHTDADCGSGQICQDANSLTCAPGQCGFACM
jgi:hypothetical protein